MRFLVILCLFSYLNIISAGHELTNGDCNDHSIFSAVDMALKTYNAEKKDGNQFVLYRITDAQIKHENDIITHQFVKYGIREGSCGVNSGNVWQECDFNSPYFTLGQCSAHVLFNKELESREIISQNCSDPIVEAPVEVIKQPILGQYQPLDTNNEELLIIVRSAVEKMNNAGNHPFLFALDFILTAERQVVAGWNYKTTYQVKQTNCSKSAFSTVTSKDCHIDKNANKGNCFVRVFMLPTEEIKDMFIECITDTGYCLNCPHAVEPSDPFLQNLLKEAINEYNSISNDTNLGQILKVMDAKKDTTGLVYEVKFTFQETNCSKLEYSFLEEHCQGISSSPQLTCEVSINVTGKNIQTKTKCEKQSVTRIMKGLSPLRIREFGPATDTVSIRSKRAPNKHKEHHKENHEKQKKKDKEKKKHHHKDESSEESKEKIRKKGEVTVKPLVPGKPIPERTTKQTSVLSTTHHPLIPDATIKPLRPEAHTRDTPTQQNIVPTTDHVATSDNLDQNIPLLPDSTDSPLFSLLPALPDDHDDNFFNIHGETFLDLPEPKCPGKEWQPIRSLPTLNPLTPTIGTGSVVQIPNSDPAQPFTDEDLFDILDFSS